MNEDGEVDVYGRLQGDGAANEDKRRLPPPELWDTELASQKMLVRPIVYGASEALGVAGIRTLDGPEKISLENAGAAYLYQEAAELDASTLLIITVLGIAIPRVTEYLEKKAQAEQVPKHATSIHGETIERRQEAIPATRALVPMPSVAAP